MVAAAITIAWSVVVWNTHRGNPAFVSDFDQIWYAARLLFDGKNPYNAIGPGREVDLGRFSFYYPLTAPVAAAPLAVLPLLAARILFVAIPTFLLAFLATRTSWVLLPLFLSRGYYVNMHYIQWGPWLACAVLTPWAAWWVAGKPNLGAASLSALQNWRQVQTAVVVALVPVIISVLVWPWWVADWLQTVRSADHFISYVTLPGGFLLLLALLRWRRWDARLLLLLAIVPQTPAVQPTLPLLLTPVTWPWSIGLSLATFAPQFLLAFTGDFSSFATIQRSVGLITLVTLYVPVLVMLLRRPNVYGATTTP